MESLWRSYRRQRILKTNDFNKVKMSNEVQESYINQVGQVQFEQPSKDDSSSESSSEVSDHGSDETTEAQTVSERAKSWFTRYEQFLYGVVVGGAAVVCSLSVRSLIRSK